MANKDWYWECEPAEVLADEGLALIPSPDGWPDEGLACCGLYWFMLCVMHRSPRRGYLLDPTSGLPLTTEGLARMVHRSVQVVDKVQQIILSRKAFSVSADGTIFSRGMVKREELRQKRRNAGSKGGNATALLKQTVQQIEQQSVGMVLSSDSIPRKEEKPKTQIKDGGVGEGCAPILKLHGEAAETLIDSPDRETPEGLAWTFRSTLSRPPNSQETVESCAAHFADLIRAGISGAAILAEIRRHDRLKADPIWNLVKELKPKSNRNGSASSARIGVEQSHLDAYHRKQARDLAARAGN